MTREVHQFGDSMQKEAFNLVGLDVNFASGRFPDYLLGVNNIIIEPEEKPQLPSLKDIVAKETLQLLEQQERLSVRDLAKKFEESLLAANKLSDEVKWKEVSTLERQVLIRKLRDVLFSWRSHATEADEAITMVEALAVQLTHREGELIREKAELQKLATFLKQAVEDAKMVVKKERALAQAEIESAKAAIERVETAVQEQEASSRSPDEQMKELEELKHEIQEARRIKMLHQPSKVMDMELELQALRIQLAEKSSLCIQLKKELAMIKRQEENVSDFYEFEGSENLGSSLRIVPRILSAPDISNFSIQWYRVSPEGTKKDLILGATQILYAPEPFDVGWLLQAEVLSKDLKVTVTTSGAIDPAAGLGSYVEELARKPDTEFKVVVIQMNAQDYPSKSIHVLQVGKMGLKLSKGKKTIKAKESYSSSMQLCGVRGDGDAAAQAIFWQVRRGLSFVLALESERERNAAIMLARRFASDCNIMLAGPDDKTSVEA